MIVTITRAQKIGICYAVLVALLFGVAAILIGLPVKARIDVADRLASQREVYARSLLAIEQREMQVATTESADEGIPDDWLFRADTDALAGADLQEDIKAIVEREGGSLVSSAFTRPREESALPPVSVQVRLRASVQGLVAVLGELDRSEPRLFVENVSIQSRHRPDRPLTDLSEELDVEFDVTGYLRPREVP